MRLAAIIEEQSANSSEKQKGWLSDCRSPVTAARCQIPRVSRHLVRGIVRALCRAAIAASARIDRGSGMLIASDGELRIAVQPCQQR